MLESNIESKPESKPGIESKPGKAQQGVVREGLLGDHVLMET